MSGHPNGFAKWVNEISDYGRWRSINGDSTKASTSVDRSNELLQDKALFISCNSFEKFLKRKA